MDHKMIVGSSLSKWETERSRIWALPKVTQVVSNIVIPSNFWRLVYPLHKLNDTHF